MYTKIKTKEGREVFFRTKQYDVGVYVIQDDNPAMQFGLDMSEEEFHKQLRDNPEVEVLEAY